MSKPLDRQTSPGGEQPLVTTRRARFGPEPLPPAERARRAAWNVSSMLAKVALLAVFIILLVTAGPKLRIPRDVVAMMPAYLARFFESGPSEQTFGVGSAKEQVRAVQGPPSFETERVWRYGDSEVYFAGGRVIGWRAAGPNALKTN